jgi:hypothetical protein
MYQRGEMNELDHRPEEGGAWIPSSSRLFGQQQKGRPEHLSLHLEQMGVDLGDEAEIGFDDPPKLLLHSIKPGTQPMLQVCQSDGSSL